MSDETQPRDAFVPRGAITFFLLMVLLGIIIWYGIYFFMIDTYTNG